jgi:hypothetical protein
MSVASPRRLSRVASRVGGAFLAAGTQGVSALRQAGKPLHPEGELLDGRIYRTGSDQKTGVAWLDEAGENSADVRRSRAIGLPSLVPDIHGLAVRVHTDEGYGDVLLASTGRGRVSRFVLTASRNPRSRPLTTLLPYQTDSGAVLLEAAAVGTETYELSWARPTGDWQSFGVLRLSPRRDRDSDISFDPLRHQLAGLRQYPSVRRLREPAYLRARRSRGESTAGSESDHAS